mmetsp:Transcript_25545/g.58645  ORF Transcript_25545/g.58645 Transcript_25545/m.58645 type:complete len:221 (-) Transcript_25545:77-739(-)
MKWRGSSSSSSSRRGVVPTETHGNAIRFGMIGQGHFITTFPDLSQTDATMRKSIVIIIVLLLFHVVVVDFVQEETLATTFGGGGLGMIHDDHLLGVLLLLLSFFRHAMRITHAAAQLIEAKQLFQIDGAFRIGNHATITTITRRGGRFHVAFIIFLIATATAATAVVDTIETKAIGSSSKVMMRVLLLTGLLAFGRWRCLGNHSSTRYIDDVVVCAVVRD